MRRFALPLAVMAAVALSACSGGGSVLSFNNSNNADRVIVTTLGSTNVARVIPGSPIDLSAVAVRGSTNGTLSNNTFKWSAALVSSGTYPTNSSGVTKACNAVTVTSQGTTGPLVTDFSQYITVDPTNSANIVFTPPAIIPVPAAILAVSPAATVTPTYPYCVVVSATGSGATGSITVAVVNPAAPLN
ncbi:hypothetical protein WPS_35040 [Vulcanimicrobium alpinum]|uniref:Lipoprotein n=1 Tax=Vulcanimicrobium alpinum TaxID=3016050 RepID=A0AAN1Y0N2_UNVUL|nr:hypothetical protein [Vulcanimicrobium alpinum]BDE08228.1 hypothetical protein WPS_35040 [Vulcanimicrobium alpinum]